ncbi:IPExxxVDY family protein [Robiginitalea marina]|uniref:IPExxxVDY family protein n=1 Tax=Robiginitalea marina TaxID=2954105 RepID=A0ABT1AWH9_9FLAO|nr:IPExxxVDY family protein [Robiginitalea marina]MCO5724411.1 IPExxxVDY family protein [Robiginitalea marina]
MGALEEFWESLLDEASYSLFAIHSNVEDHAMAYVLNEACGLRLKRTPRDLELVKQGVFTVFSWKDEASFREWTLFRNPGRDAMANPSEGLFAGETTLKRPYLVPEKKEVDYFLKLEGEEQELKVLSLLLALPRVITAYRLDTSKLKSRYNLIY